jgi:hypothetical protein
VQDGPNEPPWVEVGLRERECRPCRDQLRPCQEANKKGFLASEKYYLFYLHIALFISWVGRLLRERISYKLSKKKQNQLDEKWETKKQDATNL